MSSAICFNLDQSKNLSSGKGLMLSLLFTLINIDIIVDDDGDDDDDDDDDWVMKKKKKIIVNTTHSFTYVLFMVCLITVWCVS